MIAATTDVEGKLVTCLRSIFVLRYGLVIILFTVALAFTGCGKEQEARYDSPDITVEELRAHVQFLASEELNGRRTGTPGAVAASDYLVAQLKRSKIPPGNNGQYFQRFRFTADVRLAGKNTLSVRAGEESNALLLNEEFRPLGFSGSATVRGPLVFAGYGITSDSLGYDDYAGIDVSGKIVLVLRYGPEGDNPQGEFGEFISLRYKAENAREHGALGMIVIPGPAPYADDRLIPLEYDRHSEAGIPAVSAKREPFQTLFVSQRDSLREIQADLNLHKTGTGFAFNNVTAQLRTDLRYVRRHGRNVIGFVEGRHPEHRDEALVIGAHFDHLGVGGEGSLVPDTVVVHHGADDNASGTAALLELAEYFSMEGNRLRHSLIFAAFSGEELGLLGSSRYTEVPPFPLDRTLAMFNLDMIGRPQDSTLIIEGVGTSPVWDSLVTEANRVNRWTINPEGIQGYGASDHVPFYAEDIPVLFFYTGMHGDYHRPTDDWEKLNYSGFRDVVSYIAGLIRITDRLQITPPFAESGLNGSRRSRYRVVAGIVPEYATTIQGVRIAEVEEAGPAAQAGLQSGDIIRKFGDRDVNNVYDYTMTLQSFEPGAVVDMIVLRDGIRRRFSVVLERGNVE